MNSIIPDKLKEELEDVGKVYNSRSGVCVYPNAFSRLQTEIMKVCNKNKNLEAQIEKMKQDLDNARESANKKGMTEDEIVRWHHRHMATNPLKCLPSTGGVHVP